MPKKTQRSRVAQKTSSRTSTVSRYHIGDRRASFVDPAQYAHVRGDLIRIAILAFSLFAALVVLRILTSAFHLLP
ncbi:MAG: hypothetical protein ACP5SI_07500 [Chloroflexia bacterium]